MVPIAGMILAIVSAVLTLLLIWKIVSSQNEAVYKTIAIAGLFAFTLAQLSLLSLANLAAKFQWALTAVYLVALILAAIISVLIVIEPSGQSDFVLRLIGILGVIDAALTVMIPIFHRLSLGDFAANQPEIEKIEAEMERLKAELSRLEQRREEILKKDE
jgi:CDP-diglyceride synthetase